MCIVKKDLDSKKEVQHRTLSSIKRPLRSSLSLHLLWLPGPSPVAISVAKSMRYYRKTEVLHRKLYTSTRVQDGGQPEAFYSLKRGGDLRRYTLRNTHSYNYR